MEAWGDETSLSTIALGVLLLGTFGGVAIMYVFAAVVFWTGRWIGGQASARDIRAGFAWSGVPVILGLLLWIPAFALLGSTVFSAEPSDIELPRGVVVFFLATGFLKIALYIWSLVIFLNCLIQLQQFSIWKALSNWLLGCIVLASPKIVVELIG